MEPITNITGRLGNQMFQFAYLMAQELDGIIPDTFIQDPKYFDKYRTHIKSVFGKDIVPTDDVAIHVRRGTNPTLPSEPPYAENPFYVNLFNSGYYERAMEEFPDASFVVFSDDIEWCKKQLLFKGCEFSEGNDQITDMNLMAGCKGMIMANSTFSWWAAYLGFHDKKVIAPKEWHPDGVERTKLLPEWKQV
jgi:hypothetical protein